MDLKTIRAKKRVTQWDLRLKTEINQTKLSLLENGYLKPSEEEAKKIASALGVNVAEIQYGATPRQNNEVEKTDY